MCKTFLEMLTSDETENCFFDRLQVRCVNFEFPNSSFLRPGFNLNSINKIHKLRKTNIDEGKNKVVDDAC